MSVIFYLKKKTKNIYRPFNACCHSDYLCHMHWKREAHNCEKKQDWKSEEWTCCDLLHVYIEYCIYVCLLKEEWFVNISILDMNVWIDRFHICWYGNVYIQFHMLYILLHLQRVVSHSRVADVKMFIFLSLYILCVFSSRVSEQRIFCTCPLGAIFTH